MERTLPGFGRLIETRPGQARPSSASPLPSLHDVTVRTHVTENARMLAPGPQGGAFGGLRLTIGSTVTFFIITAPASDTLRHWCG